MQDLLQDDTWTIATALEDPTSLIAPGMTIAQQYMPMLMEYQPMAIDFLKIQLVGDEQPTLAMFMMGLEMAVVDY